jgi:hypothetical protein
MRALAAAGDRAGALTQYRRCAQVLAEELGVAPDPATTAVYDRIRARHPTRRRARLQDAVDGDVPLSTSPEALSAFFGEPTAPGPARPESWIGVGLLVPQVVGFAGGQPTPAA